MEIVKIPKDNLDEIEPLWLELNSHHHKKFGFKERFHVLQINTP